MLVKGIFDTDYDPHGEGGKAIFDTDYEIVDTDHFVKMVGVNVSINALLVVLIIFMTIQTHHLSSVFRHLGWNSLLPRCQILALI